MMDNGVVVIPPAKKFCLSRFAFLVGAFSRLVNECGQVFATESEVIGVAMLQEDIKSFNFE